MTIFLCITFTLYGIARAAYDYIMAKRVNSLEESMKKIFELIIKKYDKDEK